MDDAGGCSQLQAQCGSMSPEERELMLSQKITPVLEVFFDQIKNLKPFDSIVGVCCLGSSIAKLYWILCVFLLLWAWSESPLDDWCVHAMLESKEC